MSRIARAVAAGFPHHVVQRGNNRENVFIDDEDREKYIKLLKKYSKERDARILAYCLMSNHVHLLIKPASSIMKCNTWESRKGDAILSVYGKTIQTENIAAQEDYGRAGTIPVLWIRIPISGQLQDT